MLFTCHVCLVAADREGALTELSSSITLAVTTFMATSCLWEMQTHWQYAAGMVAVTCLLGSRSHLR